MSIHVRGLDRALRPAAEYSLQVARDYGLRPVVTSTYRSWADQARLRDRYEKCLARGEFGRTPECRYPANRPGQSAHQYRVAWDSWVPPEQMPTWTAIRRWVGWQVYDHDSIHAELPNWRSYLA